ncbi:MAG: beta-ketoacyl synthase N-terminal-like domain-containing protein [bacterium]
MTSPVDQYRERLAQAMQRLGALRDALTAERRRHRAPVAVVGIGCRLPGGVDDPERFFDGLLAGRDHVGPAPAARFGEAAAALPPGGWLADVAGFDAGFFGISPREAAALDPQHRLLLEVAWEAFERAGLPPAALPADRVGVFVGIAGGDYLPRLLADSPDVYAITGNGGAFASGRLAYSFGFRGPAVALDTACSSSLVALHLAVASLRRGECDVALVGGVNVIVEPDGTRLLQASGALSPRGRCAAFDASADGFARAEGAVAVVLRRLEDAEAAGDPVLAIVRGSAINQDGRSTGLTAPNVAAQRTLLRAALADAGVAPGEIGYIEAHGTGTALGDPIEFDAIQASYGINATNAMPCVIGAVKSNLGHLEAAAGLAGLVKVIGALRRGQIPANLHYTRPNPHLAIDGTRFVLPAAPLPFPAAEHPRRAAVSAFGMSGTNAHVIVEAAPPAAPIAAAGPALVPPLLTLSAREPAALRALAAATAAALAAGLDPVAAARTSALGRTHHPHRLALPVTADLAATLAAFAAGEPVTIEAGEARAADAPVFVCAGQGTAWPGMGRALCALPAARALIDAAAPIVAAHGGFDLVAALCETDAPLDRTAVAQPAIVVVTLATAAALAAHGVSPAAVIGHSVGELAAAHLAGALTLEETLRLACVRGRVMQPTAGAGAMAAVALDPEDAAARIAPHGPALAIAALNGPRATVVAGEPAAIDALVAALAADGIRARRLAVAHAFHGPQMDAVLPAFAAAAPAFTAAPPARALYSTVTGAAATRLDLAHWQAGIRRPVRFADAVQAAAADGHRLFVEVGPHPALGSAIAALVEGGRAVPTLRRDGDAARALADALAALHVEGAPVDLAPLSPPAPVAPLPTYPWQRRPHWIGPGARPAPAAVEAEAPAAAPAALDRAAIERRVRAEVAAVLGLGPADPLPARRGLFDLGLDSMMSVELARRLARAFDRPLAPTLAFEHPTVDALVDHLTGALTGALTAAAPARAAATREPIAIIGMACRFPGGAHDPDAFWRLLVEGRSGVVDVPPDRWDRDAYFDPRPGTPGKMYCARGGFLQGLDLRAFDAGFFGISPGEAKSLDPQQRLLLELTWEALDDAGRAPDRLEGSRTGVYVGIATSDYGQMIARRPLTEIEPSFATGSAMNTAAGRIAWHLGAHGPAIALDTACSSSLVAAALAVESLRRGETDLAIVGGVNLWLDPAIGVLYATTGGVAPDGVCKAFDAGADGMVRSEGAAVIVLARLGDARRARDRVHAVVRGVAVNHDGRSSGLTVPSGAAQRAVVRDALADAGVAAAAIEYVEAHGTGTALGDPIEANALVDVLGPGRGPDAPLRLGAAKANVGHLEAAAGLVGLIKVVQAMRHRLVPPQPTFTRLNPAIVPGEVPLVVPTAPLPWPGRLAGLSSFGISGTNAHVILEAPDAIDAIDAIDATERGALLLPLSAHHPDALAALAAEWRDRLAEAQAPAAALCAAAALRRAHLPHRLAFAAADRDGLVAALDAWRRGDDHDERWSAGEAADPPRVAFVFSGHGGAWAGMGRRLIASEPAAARVFAACDAAYARLRPGHRLAAALDAPETWGDKATLHPLTAALQLALTAALAARGVEPAAIVGHSSGEAAAAAAAGALAPEDAIRVALARAEIIARIVGHGMMAVVGLAPADLEPALAPYAGRVGVAVHNAPRQSVLSGDVDAVEALGRKFAADNIFYRPVAGADGAGHSHHFDPHLRDLVAALADLTPRAGRIALYSTVTAGPLDPRALDARYWARNLRERVRFAEAVAELRDAGIDAFVEIGPHPVLLRAIEQSAPRAALVAAMRREADDAVALAAAIGALYTRGAAIDWRRLHPHGAPAMPLPRVPWRRTAHWMPPPPAAPTGRHPLAERELTVARTGERICEATITADRRDLPPPLDVQGDAVLAPALVIEFARVAVGALAAIEPGPPIAFAARVELQAARQGETFDLHARVDDGDWRRLGGGRVGEARADGEPLAALRARITTLDDGWREARRARGLRVPPALDALDRVWRAGGEALARLGALGGQWAEAAATAAGLDLLMALALPADNFPIPGELSWPRAIEVVAPLTGVPVWLHAAFDGGCGRVTAYDAAGRVVGGLGGVRLAPPDRDLARRAVAARLARWTLDVEWRPIPPPAGAAVEPGAWALLGDHPLSAALAAGLAARGHRIGDLDARPLRGVVDLRGLDGDGDLEAAAAAFVQSARALAAVNAPRYLALTRGGQAARPATRRRSPPRSVGPRPRARARSAVARGAARRPRPGRRRRRRPRRGARRAADARRRRPGRLSRRAARGAARAGRDRHARGADRLRPRRDVARHRRPRRRRSRARALARRPRRAPPRAHQPRRPRRRDAPGGGRRARRRRRARRGARGRRRRRGRDGGADRRDPGRAPAARRLPRRRPHRLRPARRDDRRRPPRALARQGRGRRGARPPHRASPARTLRPVLVGVRDLGGRRARGLRRRQPRARPARPPPPRGRARRARRRLGRLGRRRHDRQRGRGLRRGDGALVVGAGRAARSARRLHAERPPAGHRRGRRLAAVQGGARSPRPAPAARRDRGRRPGAGRRPARARARRSARRRALGRALRRRRRPRRRGARHRRSRRARPRPRLLRARHGLDDERAPAPRGRGRRRRGAAADGRDRAPHRVRARHLARPRGARRRAGGCHRCHRWHR